MGISFCQRPNLVFGHTEDLRGWKISFPEEIRDHGFVTLLKERNVSKRRRWRMQLAKSMNEDLQSNYQKNEHRFSLQAKLKIYYSIFEKLSILILPWIIIFNFHQRSVTSPNSIVRKFYFNKPITSLQLKGPCPLLCALCITSKQKHPEVLRIAKVWGRGENLWTKLLETKSFDQFGFEN